MSTRRELREQILKMLYQLEVGKSTPDEVFDFYKKEEKPRDADADFIKKIFYGVTENKEALDEQIAQIADNWKLNRIAVIDKNVLRMAYFEIKYCPDIPNVVSINEAVDIAKKFSTEDSGKFVNGLLDKMKNELAKKGPSKG